MLTQVPNIDSPLVDRIDPVTYVIDPDVGNKDIRGRPRQADGNGNGLYYFDIGPVERDDSQPEFVSIPAAPGPITLGTGALTVSGGTWNVAAVNNYSGKTFLNGGRLQIPALTALGPIPTNSLQSFAS